MIGQPRAHRMSIVRKEPRQSDTSCISPEAIAEPFGLLAVPYYHTTVSHLFGYCASMPKTSTNKLLPTTLVGSYPQPDWLIDRRRLAEIVPPRAHAHDLWRIDPSHLQQAQDDATILAIQDQERAGIDIVTDGEIRRESYSNRFATALDGMD